MFGTGFEPNIRTRDVDFFYKNVNVPRNPVLLVDELLKQGFGVNIDQLTEVTTFFKADLLELEFLTMALGSGNQVAYKIPSLGIKSEGLRGLGILNRYPHEIESHGFIVIVPEPAAYAVQKILANPTRKDEKKEKDLRAVSELLPHIRHNEYHALKLREVLDSLTVKEMKALARITEENHLELSQTD